MSAWMREEWKNRFNSSRKVVMLCARASHVNVIQFAETNVTGES